MDGLVCRQCHNRYSLDDPVWQCSCGGLLDVEFTPDFSLDSIASRPPDMWRYREAIPVARNECIASFSEGFTPLIPWGMDRKRIHLKCDFLFPTGSFKDRGASVLISKLKELGIGRIVEDSSGNAGAAIAAYAASTGIGCDIFIPEHTSQSKTLQIQSYGARVHRIPGTREDTARAALDAAGSRYYASHSRNPFFLQGTKTVAYEICEQLGWIVPDAVVAPVGNGTLLLGLYIGFKDLMNAGIAGRLPKLIGVQAARCAPLYRVFRENEDNRDEVKYESTVAEGIAVADPVRSGQIIEAVRESGGRIITVEEYEIAAGLREMVSGGLFIEPTAAAGIAGVKKYLTGVSHEELTVTVLTGHGLKSAEKISELLHI